MGSKGGQTQTTKSEPWSAAQPYLRDIYGDTRSLTSTPRQFYPGQTSIGALPSELNAYGQRSAYNSMMFGSPLMQANAAGAAMPFSPIQSGPLQVQQLPPLLGSGSNKGGTMGAVMDAATQLKNGTLGGQTPAGGTGASLGDRVAQYAQNAQANGAQGLGGKGGLAQPATQPSATQPTGMQPAGTPFGNALGAMNQSLTGQDALGSMAGRLAPYATNALQGAFNAGVPQVGRYGFDTSLNPSALTPTFGQAGGLDARGTLAGMMSGQADWGGAGAVAGAGNAPLSGQPDWGGAMRTAGLANAGLGQFGTAGSLNATDAIQRALSGQPDYAGLQGAVDAANAPILRQLNEQVIPGLNQRATFLNNETGGIKTLNSVLPEVGQRMAENAQGLYNQERLRALSDQQQAAGLVAQGGLQQGAQASGQLFGAGQSALDRAAQQASQMASQNYGAYGNAWQQAMADRANAANLVSTGGLSAYGLGLQGATTEAGLRQALAGMNLQTDTTNAGLMNQYRGDLLNLGSLASGLTGDQAMNTARWGALFPSLAQAGAMPSQDALAFGNYQRGLAENALQGDMNRWNFYQQEPYDRLSFYNQILNGTAGLGGTQTTSGGGGGGLAGAIGGAASLGGLAATLGASGPVGWGVAGLGGLLGLFG